MATRIQIRRDTSLNWEQVNPVLSPGELALELDTNSIKCGDGTTAWTELGYITDIKSGNDLGFDDNSILEIGTDNDLLIYHDDPHSYIINETADSNLYIRGANEIRIGNTAGETGLLYNSNGSVALYWDNQKRLETTQTGVDVAGHINADSISVDGNTVAVLELQQEFTKAQHSASVNITLDQNRVADLHLSNVFIIDVQETFDFGIINPEAGGCYTFLFKNTGAFDANFSSNFYFSGGQPTLTDSGNDLVSCVSDGTNLYCSVIYSLEAAQ